MTIPGAPTAFSPTVTGGSCFLPDEASFVWAQGKEVSLVDVATGEARLLAKGRLDSPCWMEVSPDATHVAVADHTGAMRVIQLAKGKVVTTIDKDLGCERVSWLNPERLVVLRRDHSLALLDASGATVSAVTAHSHARGLAVDAARGRVLTVGEDGVALWSCDGQSFALQGRGLHAAQEASQATFDASGERALVASNQTLWVFDPASLLLLHSVELISPSHATSAVAFVTPDQVAYTKNTFQPAVILHTLGATEPAAQVNVTLQRFPAPGRTGLVASRGVLVRWA